MSPTARVLFQPSIRYEQGAAGRGLGNLGFDIGAALNNGLQSAAKTAAPWYDPNTYINAAKTGIDAFKTISGQSAQEAAQANLIQLQQARAQAELMSGAQFQQTISQLAPWVIGGAVVLTGIIVLSKVLK